MAGQKGQTKKMMLTSLQGIVLINVNQRLLVIFYKTMSQL